MNKLFLGGGLTALTAEEALNTIGGSTCYFEGSDGNFYEKTRNADGSLTVKRISDPFRLLEIPQCTQ